MSQGNLEVVNAGWEAWIRGDLNAYFELCDPAVEWDTTNYEGWPEDDIYHGHDGVRRFLEEWRASWEQYEAGVEEYLDIDSARVPPDSWCCCPPVVHTSVFHAKVQCVLPMRSSMVHSAVSIKPKD
jgi:hypothetical protein